MALATAYNFQGLSTHATELLLLLASFLNPDRIQEYIFVNPQAAKENGKSHWTASTFETARYELLRSSIVKRNIYRKELWIV